LFRSRSREAAAAAEWRDVRCDRLPPGGTRGAARPARPARRGVPAPRGHVERARAAAAPAARHPRVVRIIAGRWRGHPLTTPGGQRTRPTTDRVREAWMSVLQHDLPGARVLDLFAGSGALGLEALSRGATHATIVERAAAGKCRGGQGGCTSLRAPAGARRIRHRPRGSAVRRGVRDRTRRAVPRARLRTNPGGRAPHEGVARPCAGRTDSPLRRYGTHFRDAGTMTERKRVAIYPGSFDPVTRGHEDIVRRALGFCDVIIVAVAHRRTQRKDGLFTIEERLELLREVFRDEPRIRTAEFEGLLVDFARENGASLLVRGLRAVSDFEYEFQMASMNR